MDAALLYELNRSDTAPVFLTGAGVSVASGIPTFRGPDPDAVWAKDVTELGTVEFFRKNPADQWSWYLSRFAACRGALPNPAHTAIADLERRFTAKGRPFAVITQNIDGLHHAAGSRALMEVHGAARRLRCSRDGCEHGAPRGSLPWDEALFAPFQADPSKDRLPKCPACGSLLRPHVLWFDEMYTDHEDYAYDRAHEALLGATCLVFVGTSFSVGITSLAIQAAAMHRIPTWILDPHATTVPLARARLVREPAEVFLPQLAESLERLHGEP